MKSDCVDGDGVNKLLKSFWRKNKYKKHSLVHRLRQRQLGTRRDVPTFSQNLPLSGTVARIDTPINSFPRKFTPDGNQFICFTQFTVELYKYEGSARAAKSVADMNRELKSIEATSAMEKSRRTQEGTIFRRKKMQK